ncbi:MAG: hypothetical protein HOW73_44865 [Polyangiaceae bacterium]|nr:hypothetical protein [Polyangiaceae bacterium]
MTAKEALVGRLTAAEAELSSAQLGLDDALRALLVGSRMRKVAISREVQDAFSKLRAARRELTAVQAELALA